MKIAIRDFLEYSKLKTDYREVECGTSTDWREWKYPFLFAHFQMWGIDFYFEQKLSRLDKKKERKVIGSKFSIDGYKHEIRFQNLEQDFDTIVEKVIKLAQCGDIFAEHEHRVIHCD